MSHRFEHAFAQNTQACERIKIPHLINSESYFLPSHSLRVSMLYLSNWGGVGADRTWVEDLVQSLLLGTKLPEEKALLSMAKSSARCSSERHLSTGVIFWRDPDISVWQKSRNILERKSDLCVNEEYSWKETLLRNWNLETAVVLDWVISSLYTLIIDGTLITMTALGDAFVFAFLSTSLCKQVVSLSSCKHVYIRGIMGNIC